jgi:gamma-tubulin complex component 5
MQTVRPSKTLEAFSEAVGEQINRLELWCARREEDMLATKRHSPTIVSLLSLEQAIRNEFSETFMELLSILRKLNPNRRLSCQDDFKELFKSSATSPSQFAAQLLDVVTSAMESCSSFGDTITAMSLAQVFELSVAPLWDMIHRWLSDPSLITTASLGREAHTNVIPEEFFIKRSGVNVEDPDFWSEAFILRKGANGGGSGSASSVPIVFKDVADDILSAGKSLGLLHLLQRAFGLSVLEGSAWRKPWVSFDILASTELGSSPSEIGTSGHERADEQRTIHTLDNLTLLISEHLRLHCFGARATLMEVIDRNLGFWQELSKVDALFLMRNNTLAMDFSSILFSKVRCAII